MPKAIATIVFLVGISGLFWLDRNSKWRTSKALWIPVLWLLIVGSRPISQWLQIGPVDATQVTASQVYLDGSPIDRFVFMVLIAAGLIALIPRMQRVGPLLFKNGPIVLFFAYCAVSIVWSDFPAVAFKRWDKDVGELVMILIVLTDLDRSAAIKRLFARVGFLLLPISVLLIKYYPDLGRGYLPWVWTPVYTGVTTNKNTLGMISMVFGLAAVWRLLLMFRDKTGARETRSLIAQGTLVVMASWLLWTAGSATSWACFLLGGGLIVLVSRPDRRPGLVHFLVAGGITVAASVLFLDVGSGLVRGIGKDPTITGRTEIWHQVIGMASNTWLGTGYASFWLGERLQRMWALYWWHPNEAHNGYIETFLNLGWLGVVMLAVLLVTGYRRVVMAICRHEESASLCLAFFVVAVVYNFTEAAFGGLHPVWTVFLLATIVVPETPVREELPLLIIDRTPKVLKSKSHVDDAAPVALRRRTI